MTTRPDDPANDKPGDLRAQLEAEKEARRVSDLKVRDMAFQLAGVDPTKGIGKAIAATFTGDPTPEAIKAYAKSEYEVEITTSTLAPDLPPDDPAAEKVRTRQAEADSIINRGTPPTEETPAQRVARLEAEGKWGEAMDAKLNQINPVSNRS